jgi:hypothetical protein
MLSARPTSAAPTATFDEIQQTESASLASTKGYAPDSSHPEQDSETTQRR